MRVEFEKLVAGADMRRICERGTVMHAWHACVAYGNKRMKQNGVVNPCWALPRPLEHEGAERAARELAATLAEEIAVQHAVATQEVCEGVLPPLENWDAVEWFLGNEDTLALVH